MTSATIQKARRASPSKLAPATQKMPERTSQATIRWKLRMSAGLSPRPRMAQEVRPTWIRTTAPAKVSPRSPNASGTEADITSPTSITAKIRRRTGTRSGSSQLVAHEV
jgi:hypothetical protein